MVSRLKSLKLVVAVLFLVSGQVAAVELDMEFELGVGQSDNITRAADTAVDPALDATVLSIGATIDLQHQSARADLGLRGLATWIDYQDGPYDSEILPALDATGIFRITDEVLSWFFRANVGQQSVDPFEPVTPDNRQDVTYVTTGPTVSIPLGSRNSLRGDAWYSDIRYEDQPLDNNRTGAQLGFVRQMNPRRSLSLNARAERTEFEFSMSFPEIDRSDVFLEFDTEGSRNEVLFRLGYSWIERLDSKTEEPLATVEWERQLSPSTSFRLIAGYQVSDSSENFRDMQGGSLELGDVQNQQNVSAPFREKYHGLSLSYAATRTSVNFGLRRSQEDYPDTLLAGFDRDVDQLSLNFSRRLGGRWVLAGFGSLNRREYDQLSRSDDDSTFGASLTWQQLRTIEIELRFERMELDSTEESTEFTENRVYLGFRYVPDWG